MERPGCRAAGIERTWWAAAEAAAAEAAPAAAAEAAAPAACAATYFDSTPIRKLPGSRGQLSDEVHVSEATRVTRQPAVMTSHAKFLRWNGSFRIETRPEMQNSIV